MIKAFKKFSLFGIVPFLLQVVFLPAALPYEDIKVMNGGTIEGKVFLKGSLPAPRAFLLSLSPFVDFCQKVSDGKGRVLLEEFNIDREGGMSDVIVAVQEVKKGKPFPPIRAKIFATDCMFHPAEVPVKELYETDHMGKSHHIHPMVTVVQNHQPITVVNKDPIFHNGQVFQRERGNIMLNFPLPTSGEPQGGILKFDRGLRVSVMICGMHEFMQTWGFAVENPYYSKTNRQGQYTIDQLPPGTYKVHAWYPHFKVSEREVEVKADGTVQLNFEFDSKKVKRRAFETEKGIRSFN
jgi:hypothetical protein